jgi:hypothetical protein
VVLLVLVAQVWELAQGADNSSDKRLLLRNCPEHTDAVKPYQSLGDGRDFCLPLAQSAEKAAAGCQWLVGTAAGLSPHSGV